MRIARCLSWCSSRRARLPRVPLLGVSLSSDRSTGKTSIKKKEIEGRHNVSVIARMLKSGEIIAKRYKRRFRDVMMFRGGGEHSYFQNVYRCKIISQCFATLPTCVFRVVLRVNKALFTRKGEHACMSPTWSRWGFPLTPESLEVASLYNISVNKCSSSSSSPSSTGGGHCLLDHPSRISRFRLRCQLLFALPRLSGCAVVISGY